MRAAGGAAAASTAEPSERPSSRSSTAVERQKTHQLPVAQSAGARKLQHTSQRMTAATKTGTEHGNKTEMAEDDAGGAAAEAAEAENSEPLLSDGSAAVAAGRRDGAGSPSKRVKPSSSASSSSSTAAASSSAPLSSSSLSAFQSSLASSGLLYFSRLPPHFKPQKLRQLLSCYGAVGRIYCTPEQRHLTRSRLRSSSSSASSSSVRRFVDGWVEFADKRLAKAVALTLNGSSVGGSKRSFHYDDVWCCKYLPGFKWQHLTERTAVEARLRDGRRRQQLSRARKEGDAYVQQVDKSRRIEQMRQRQEKKRTRQGGDADTAAAADSGGAEAAAARPLRVFSQRQAIHSLQPL